MIGTFARQLRNQLAKGLDRNVSAREAIVAEWAAGLPAGSRVLDAGAGTCSYAQLFSGCEYVAQDHPGSTMAPPGTTVLHSDIHAIPVPDASFDAILCAEVFEHIEQPLVALAEFARILKPGGKLCLTTPAASRVHRVPTHYYGGFAPDFFEGSLPTQGLVLDRLQPVGNWSQFMAQELSRLPQIMRHNLAAPDSIRRLAQLATWPLFRVGLPLAFIGLSQIDRTDDLPFGWVAFAHRASQQRASS